MEAFEQFVALAMESEGLVVSSAVKFDVGRRTRKAAYEEVQKHGYEVDLLGARADCLVLATVKSFFGSRGVVADQVMGQSSHRGTRHYLLLNDPEVRDGVIEQACKRYGYDSSQVQLRMYVGKFAGHKHGEHERMIREWCGRQRIGNSPIGVYGLKDVVDCVLEAASRKQYRDNAVLVTLKVLKAAGLLPSTLQIASERDDE